MISSSRISSEGSSLRVQGRRPLIMSRVGLDWVHPCVCRGDRLTDCHVASPASNAAAAEITVWPADKSGRIFVDVSGDIAVGDEKTFGEKTANLDADHISLVSDGGNSITGGSIGDIIRFRGMNIYVPPNATCASICAFIWLAGSAKFVANSSHIGVHGAYNTHTLQPSNEMNILLAVYLAQLSYNYDDVLWMLLPPPGNMHWLTPETAKEHHIYWAELSPTRKQSPL